MGMELTGDALHLGPLLGHAAHLTRERMMPGFPAMT